MNSDIVDAINSTLLDIAIQVGNDNSGFAGDALSQLIAPNAYELWEGTGYIIQLPHHVLCVVYGPGDPKVNTFAQNDIQGIVQWIKDVDVAIRNQIVE